MRPIIAFLIGLALLLAAACGIPSAAQTEPVVESITWVLIDHTTLEFSQYLRVVRHVRTGSCFVLYSGNGRGIVEVSKEVCQ